MEIKINANSLEYNVIKLNEAGYTVESSLKTGDDIILQYREKMFLQEIPRIYVKKAIQFKEKKVKEEILNIVKLIFESFRLLSYS